MVGAPTWRSTATRYISLTIMNTVRLIHTNGYALECEVELNDTRFIAMDAFSPAGGSSKPGDILEPEISCLDIESPTWEAFFNGNPDKRKEVIRSDSWNYRGFGQVTAINPMIVDFGMLQLQGGPATHDERCIGAYVSGNIRRLQIFGKPQRPMEMETGLLNRIKRFFRLGSRRESIFDFNIVGVDDYLQKNDAFLAEAEKIKLSLRDFNVTSNREIDEIDKESDKNIIKQRKLNIANRIIDELKALHEIGKRNAISKADYKRLRVELLMTLVRLFESYAERDVFTHSVHILEENGIIPKGSEVEIMKLTPMGRWL